MGWSREEMKEGLFLKRAGISPIHHERHTFSSTWFSIGDFSTSGSSHTKNSTNSTKNDTIILGIPQFFAQLTVRG
jgi:hypothetical protein